MINVVAKVLTSELHQWLFTPVEVISNAKMTGAILYFGATRRIGQTNSGSRKEAGVRTET